MTRRSEFITDDRRHNKREEEFSESVVSSFENGILTQLFLGTLVVDFPFFDNLT